MKARGVVLLLILLALTVPTDATPAAPSVVAIYVDTTRSAAAGRATFLDQLEQALVRDRCLGRGELAIITSGELAQLVYAGPARDGAAIRRAFALVRAGMLKTQTGSDVVSGLDIAERWLAKREFQARRRILIGWADMENTAAKRPNGKSVRYADPHGFRWSHAHPPEVHLYGLPLHRHDSLRRAWAAVRPCLHIPGESFELRHFGWKRSLF